VTGGQGHEITQAEELVSSGGCKWVIADRGYDSDEFRMRLRQQGIEPVIPGKKNRKIAIDFDKHIYKERNFVERFFNKIKGFRRIATRYDKTAQMYLGALLIAGIMLWLQI
jgi:transposase